MRRHSIDIFRGLTMFLMIFVNDLWTLESYPKWLGHASVSEDLLGFSDIIFPAFLFIVGLSIPLAIDRRYEKGDNHFQVMWHVLIRTLALLIMGFFIVNFENMNREVMPISAGLWEVIMAAAFFLIWTNYPNKRAFGVIPEKYMQAAGLLVLFFLTQLYRGPDGTNAMDTYWWGILGLIGWSYLYVAIVYLFAGKRLVLLILAFVLFNYLNAQEFFAEDMGWYKMFFLESASHYSLTMGGTLATVLMLKVKNRGFVMWIFIIGAAWLAYGYILRPYWGINKILATPSWTAITGGISYLTFGVLVLIADFGKIINWAKPLGPAGRSTLTAYIIPYIFYPVAAWIGFQLPEMLRTGWMGVVKCLVFSAVIIAITRLLELAKMRLKI